MVTKQHTHCLLSIFKVKNTPPKPQTRFCYSRDVQDFFVYREETGTKFTRSVETQYFESVKILDIGSFPSPGRLVLLAVFRRLLLRNAEIFLTRGKHSQKPKDEPNSKNEKTPSTKKLHLEDDSSSQASSKESYNRRNVYWFQDVNILRRVILACAVCKECFQGTLQLFEKISGCGLARLSCCNAQTMIAKLSRSFQHLTGLLEGKPVSMMWIDDQL